MTVFVPSHAWSQKGVGEGIELMLMHWRLARWIGREKDRGEDGSTEEGTPYDEEVRENGRDAKRERRW